MAIRGSAPLTYLARYPFLPGAEELLGEGGAPSLRDLVTAGPYLEARRSARDSLEKAARDPVTPSPELDPGEELAPSMRYLAFQYARLLLAMPGVLKALERRWCLHQAKSAWGTLNAKLAVATPGATEAKSREVIFVADRLGLTATLSQEPGHVALSVPTYVHLASPIREEGFRLAAQKDVRDGKVTVSLVRAARLLQEGMRLYLLSLPRLEPQPALVALVQEQEAAFLARVSALTPVVGDTRPQNFDPGLFPPCVKEMMAVMARGENLSHFGRFTLAAFLHKVGASMEYMVDCYRGAPDFDEDITRYQLEHISRHDDGNGYTPPECATVLSNGLCFKERDDARPGLCIDPTLRHPLNYYHRRGRSTGTKVTPGMATPVKAGDLSRNKKVAQENVKGSP